MSGRGKKPYHGYPRGRGPPRGRLYGQEDRRQDNRRSRHSSHLSHRSHYFEEETELERALRRTLERMSKRQCSRSPPRTYSPRRSRKPYQGPERRQVFNPKASTVATRTVQPSVDSRRNQPSVERRQKQPTAEKKAFVYKSPERPAFIPPPKLAKRLPKRINDQHVWRSMFITPEDNRDRIGVNSAHMMLSHCKLFLEDVYAFGFMVLHTADRANLDVLTICSPSGHVQIFQAGENGLQFPTEIQSLLFKDKDVQKLAMYKSDITEFVESNSTPPINVVELSPVLKKNIVEANNGILNFLKFELGSETRYRKVDLSNDNHVRTNALFARSLTYGLWLVASKLAEKAGLSSSSNISGYMRYAIFSEQEEKYKLTKSDPYYVPLDENNLSPLHQRELRSASRIYMPVHSKIIKKYRPRFIKPFGALLTEEDQRCKICGYFSKPGILQKCRVKPHCAYPACEDTHKHSPLTCRYIRAWCDTCQRRGHIAEQHQSLGIPPPYLWALFLHYQPLQLEVSYMLKGKKYENPFLHMFTLYGLPPSKLPKAVFETGVEPDKPNEHQRPAKPLPGPSFQVNKSSFTIPTQMARHKLTSSTTSTSTVDQPTTKPPRLFTEYDIRQACRLAERISRGQEAGTSGTTQSNPIVTVFLNSIQNLKQHGIVSETVVPSTTSQPTSVTTGDTTSTTSTPETVLEQAKQLATSLARNVLLSSIPQQSVPLSLEQEVLMQDRNDPVDVSLLYENLSNDRSEHEVNLEDSQYLFDEEPEVMDDTEPTSTAAIPQGQVVFYNDPNFSVQDQPQVEQAAILPAVNTEEEPTNPETTSQNASN